MARRATPLHTSSPRSAAQDQWLWQPWRSRERVRRTRQGVWRVAEFAMFLAKVFSSGKDKPKPRTPPRSPAPPPKPALRSPAHSSRGSSSPSTVSSGSSSHSGSRKVGGAGCWAAAAGGARSRAASPRPPAQDLRLPGSRRAPTPVFRPAGPLQRRSRDPGGAGRQPHAQRQGPQPPRGRARRQPHAKRQQPPAALPTLPSVPPAAHHPQ